MTTQALNKTTIKAAALAEKRLAFAQEPSATCNKCPRLAGFLAEQSAKAPQWWNAPVPTWHAEPMSSVRLLIVGLAPGLQGANRTGRPFTNDWAGDLLFQTLIKTGFASGKYEKHALDSLELKGTAITNAVRCVPPQNKPVAAEINQCRQFLTQQFSRFPNLDAVLTLGTIAHNSTLRALNIKQSQAPFAHGSKTQISYENRSLMLFSSYHCSRYNTNTGKLTQEMFESVFGSIEKSLNENKS